MLPVNIRYQRAALFDSILCDLDTSTYAKGTALSSELESIIFSHLEADAHELSAMLREGAEAIDRISPRIVLTNHALDARAGSELWCLDICKSLARKGVSLLCYSPVLGQVAKLMRDSGVDVTDSVDEVRRFKPDLIHINHASAAEELLSNFVGRVRIVNMIHGLLPRPGMPALENVDQYACASTVSRAKIHYLTGSQWSKIKVFPNFFDQDRFTRIRAGRTRKALLFSSRTSLESIVKLEFVLNRFGITLDHVGYGGIVSAKPEDLLPHYDIVFAVGRSAIEALASGANVILWENGLFGPLVTAANFWTVAACNFALATSAIGRFYLDDGCSEGLFEELIQRASMEDVSSATLMIRSYLSLSIAANRLLALYKGICAC